MDSEQIKLKRKEKGITQAELSKLLGVSTKTIQNYESGHVIPDTKKEILLRILGDEEVIPEGKYGINKQILDELRTLGRALRLGQDAIAEGVGVTLLNTEKLMENNSDLSGSINNLLSILKTTRDKT